MCVCVCVFNAKSAIYADRLTACSVRFLIRLYFNRKPLKAAVGMIDGA